MDFRGAIRAYQTDGNREIIDRILGLTDVDYLQNPSRKRTGDLVTIALDQPEAYVAYRIKALRERALRSAYAILVEHLPRIREFHRLLSIIYIDLRIDFGGNILKKDEDDLDHYNLKFELNPALFDSLRRLNGRIERKFKSEGFAHEIKPYGMIRDILEPLFQRIESEKDAIRADVMGCVVPALERALRFVNADREPREVVKYVNRAMLTEYYELQAAKKGLRRLRAGGFYRMVKPHFAGDIRTILGDDYEAADLKLRLTRAQYAFLQQLIGIVTSDIRDNNVENYRITVDGECRLNAAYAARELGLPYDTVKRRLARMKKSLR